MFSSSMIKLEFSEEEAEWLHESLLRFRHDILALLVVAGVSYMVWPRGHESIIVTDVS